MTNSNCSIETARWLFITREVLCLKTPPPPHNSKSSVCEFGGSPSRVAGSGLATPNGQVELCQFTPALKAELFPRLRAAFENRSLRIPIGREIREDLHAIQRTVSPSGQITYRAPHDCRSFHKWLDWAWARMFVLSQNQNGRFSRKVTLARAR